jgi:hypothetical protein
MGTNLLYRYPAKLKKFGIDDPFLNILVAKYENEIPWQSQVKNAEGLVSFVESQMLPALLKKVQWPPADEVKHHYITEKSINLESAFIADQGLNREEMALVNECRKSRGDNDASRMLAQFINKRKNEGFETWTQLLSRKYKSHPVFQYLLLRPVFDTSDSKSRRALITPQEDIVDWLFMRIEKSRITPNSNLAREYFLKSAFGAGNSVKDGWIYIRSDWRNILKLAATCSGSGWCIAMVPYAESYLAKSSFYILRAEGRPVVALRTDNNKKILECQGRFNRSPFEWYSDIYFFISSLKLNLAHRQDDYKSAIKAIDFDNQPLSWWKKRMKYWPFARENASEAVRAETTSYDTLAFFSYLDFFTLDEIKKRVNVSFCKEDYIQAVRINPTLYSSLPKEIISEYGAEIEEACLKGWKERIEDRELSDAESNQC